MRDTGRPQQDDRYDLGGSAIAFFADALSAYSASCVGLIPHIDHPFRVEFSLAPLSIRLKEAIERYKRGTSKRMTYEVLAEATGIGRGTLQTIGSRDAYNATLATVEKLCVALNVSIADLLELVPEKRKKKTKAKAKKKTKRA